MDWTAPVVYTYDDMVDVVQKFGTAKQAGKVGGATHVKLVIQVEDEEEGTMAMTYHTRKPEQTF